MVSILRGESLYFGQNRNNEMKTIETNFLVIGSGLAGLWFTYRVREAGEVILVTKKESADSNTNYAQGGIASALGEDDSPEVHLRDTLLAGEGLAKEEVVKMVVEAGPSLVSELYSLGVNFSTYYNSSGKLRFDLGREGGHSRRRIVHAKDYTGMAIEETLLALLAGRRNVEIKPRHFVLDLIVEGRECFGAWVYDRDNREVIRILSDVTLLATGGIGQLYLHTTNPAIATGDGIAMAFLKGAAVANMEFIQFHPTALFGYKIDDRMFLISEAVRGEGGILRNWQGEPFMIRYSEAGDLARRDVIARAIYSEMVREGKDYEFLDLTHLDPFRIKERFPNIYNTCRKFGVDITKEPIPVVPACHYLCGGIVINMDGETEIKRLFAAGECSCSGMHGANRLASNSLLETLVFANQAAKKALSRNQISTEQPAKPGIDAKYEEVSGVKMDKEEIRRLTFELKKAMWEQVGIVRSTENLLRNWRFLKGMWQLIPDNATDPDVLELRNMIIVGMLITRSAILRKESRGLHYNINHPLRDDKNYLRDTIIRIEEMPLFAADEVSPLYDDREL